MDESNNPYATPQEAEDRPIAQGSFLRIVGWALVQFAFAFVAAVVVVAAAIAISFLFWQGV
jgi:hypothetical protein